MFDPIKASKEIKDSYIDYITTTFDMADTDYEREFRKELQTDGMVASGPFLDIGGSYETGHTLRELIQAQKASSRTGFPRNSSGNGKGTVGLPPQARR